MGKSYNFKDLKKYATKIYKFKQGKSIEVLKDSLSGGGQAMTVAHFTDDEFNNIKGGVCSALAAAWLQEKLTSAKSPAFSGDSVGPKVHGGRNMETLVPAAKRYLHYRESASTDELLRDYGLTKGLETLSRYDLVNEKVVKCEETTSKDGKVRRNHSTINVVKVCDTLVRVCDGHHLKKGRGLLISLTFESPKRGGGHSVAAYRSRGDTLYFFDPNCGVYEVREASKFFETWIACYRKLDFEISYSQGRKDGFTYVSRP